MNGQVGYSKLGISALLFLIPTVGFLTVAEAQLDIGYLIFFVFAIAPALLFQLIRSNRGVAIFGAMLVTLVALSWVAWATATPTEFQVLPYMFGNGLAILLVCIGIALDSGWRSRVQ